MITSNLRVADGSFYLGVAQPNVDGDLNSLHFTLLALLLTPFLEIAARQLLSFLFLFNNTYLDIIDYILHIYVLICVVK